MTHHANTMGNFNPFNPILLPPRPIAYCPCGTRLSRLRPPQTSLCWACEDQRIRQRSVVELHPSPHDCPTCGTPIYRDSTHCRTCHLTHA